MATLATQSISRAGLTPAYAAASAGGDKLSPGQNTFLHVKNVGASICTVTIVTPNDAIPGVTLGDLSVSVPATTGDKMIGPLPGGFFAAAADGLAAITYSQVTSVTVAALDASA